jgi:PGF-pre-PGF domain-containing protein
MCREEFEINKIKLLLLTFLILTLSSCVGAAKDITVQPGGSIQAAVNSASSGDTIIVDPGTYTENIVINNKDNLEIRSSQGPDNTIIASNSTGKDIISIGARMNLKITGFTISGAGGGSSGINLNMCRDCAVENNKFLNNSVGIYLRSSGNIVIRNNIVTTGTGSGIYSTQSYSTTISGNNISGYTSGIYIFNSQGSNTISGNTVSQNSGSGIQLEDTNNNNTLESNIVSSNGVRGVYLARSSKNNLKNNIVSSNGGNGIEMGYSSENTVLGNKVSGNTTTINNHGIFLDNCTNSYVQSNTVSSCEYGIAMRYSNNNHVINNNANENDRGFYVAYTSSENKLSGNKANSNKVNGIQLHNDTKNNIVNDNEANLNTNYGIYLENANSNNVSNNVASQNSKGIVLQGSVSTQNTFSNNTLSYNGDGIRFDNSSENNIINNIISSSSTYGICLVGSCNKNKLQNNTEQGNKIGIYLTTSTENVISQNAVFEGDSGVMLSLANNNTLSRNIIHDNINDAISLGSSESNNISGNNVSSNGNGIYMCPRSYYNYVYNNCFNNLNNANIRNNRSTWYTDKTSGKNVMGGPNIGGNFWGSPSLMGFSDINLDNDSDGIIDIPYVSANGNVTDNYPLIRIVLPVAKLDVNITKGFVPLTVQFTDRSQDATSISWDIDGDGKSDNTNKSFVHVYEKPGTYNVTLTASNRNDTSSANVQIIAEEYKILPVANFNANVTSGYAPLSVLLTDLSQNATSRNWDIGNDGTVESKDPSIVYVFTNPGTYPVSLTAINENGTSVAKPITITVTQESSSDDDDDGGGHSSGSGGGGGGGAGGSPEPQTNVQVKELSKAQVTNGKPVVFDFTNNATCVVYVSFDAKKTAGKITTIAEQLKVKSTLTSVLDSGEVYKYFNLWVGNSGFATEENIEKPVVCFKVEKTWLQDKKIEQNSITLNRYSDKKWSQLPVKLLKEDTKYLYFTAETPGFSFFAITGKVAEKERVVEILSEPEIENSENNTQNMAVDIEHTPEQKEKTNGMPGFGVIYFIVGLLGAFRYTRR